MVAAMVLMTDVTAVPSVAMAMTVAMPPATLGLSRRAEQQRQTQHKTPSDRDTNEARHDKFLQG